MFWSRVPALFTKFAGCSSGKTPRYRSHSDGLRRHDMSDLDKKRTKENCYNWSTDLPSFILHPSHWPCQKSESEFSLKQQLPPNMNIIEHHSSFNPCLHVTIWKIYIWLNDTWGVKTLSATTARAAKQMNSHANSTKPCEGNPFLCKPRLSCSAADLGLRLPGKSTRMQSQQPPITGSILHVCCAASTMLLVVPSSNPWPSTALISI